MLGNDGELIPADKFARDRELEQRIRRPLIPIYGAAKGGVLALERSSVLLGIDGRFFLLTAMHDLSLYQSSGVRFFVPCPDSTGSGVDITGSKIIGWSEQVDIAAIRLRPNDAALLKAEEHALGLEDLDFSSDEDSRTPFAISGYPIVYNQPDASGATPLLTPYPFTLYTCGFAGEIPDRPYCKDVHLLISWENQFEAVVVNGQEIPSGQGLNATPKPKGISGGGIWILGKKSPTKNDGSRFDCRLSAIQGSVHSGLGYAIGTRVYMAIYAIWRDLPDVTAAIEKRYPGQFPLNAGT